MSVRFYATAIVILLGATPAAASDSCTVSYEIDASLQVSDTYLSKGDAIAKGLKGSLVVEYPLGRDGRVTDGKVGVLHFAMFERFTIDAIANVTTVMHHYAPTCNGARTPSWRRASDPGFPKACRYGGNEKPVALGKLSKERGTIEWARCKAAPSYWSADRGAYKPDDQSKGRGCLSEMHGVGNIRCEGRLACKFGDLKRGDNPQFGVWTQPLVHGPPGSKGAVSVSGDLRTIRTPTSRKDGFLSYNLPNDSPSRTWFSWVATADETSPHTTCPMDVDP